MRVLWIEFIANLLCNDIRAQLFELIDFKSIRERQHWKRILQGQVALARVHVLQ